MFRVVSRHSLRDSQTELEKTRQQAIGHLAQRQRSLRAKLDRGYDDYLEGRISDDFWDAEVARVGIGVRGR